MTGVELIAVERQRQIEKEGYDAYHDDDKDYDGEGVHADGQIAKAAAAYAMVSYGSAHAFEFWPWDSRYWKPSPDRVRTLVKAGALIAAEIDRLQRKSAA